MTLKADADKHRKADLAWQKEAYMVAFETRGYIYVLSSALDIVRSQLLNHGDKIIQYFKILNRDLA
jgi:hypothetical protein